MINKRMKFPKYYKSQEGKYGSVDKMEKEYSGQEIKDIFSNISSREGTDMAEFAENEININDTYVLTSVSVDDLLARDLDLRTFVAESVEDYTPNKIIKEPILLGDSNGGLTKNVVRDGYSRVTQAKANGDKQIKAYVKKGAVKAYNFEDKEVVFHAMSKGGKDWFKITYDKKYNTFDKKSPTSMGGGYSESELGRIVKNELEYTPVVLIDKLKLTSDTVKDEDYKNNYFAEKAENRSYSDKEELNEAFKNNSPADANILAQYHDLLKDIIRLFNSGVVSASRYFGEKGIIDLSKKVGSAKTFKAARELFLKFTKEATETMKDYLLQADEPAVRLIGEPLYNELKEKYVGNSDIKPEDTMKKEDRWQTIYGNLPDVAAVYSIGKSTKEVVVIKHKGKHYVIYADIAGVRREKDITHVGEAMQWLKSVLTKMSDVVGDKEVDESVIKDRLKFQYGKDLLGVNESAELKQGIKIEKEHADTIKKIATGEIKPEDAPAAIAKDHLAESKTYYKDLEKVENKGKEKQYDLGFGSMGNGTTVWNRAKMVRGDYPTIAHISDYGVVNYYGKEYPEAVKKEIEDFAAKQKKPSLEKSVDASDAEVYIEYLNKDDRFKPMKKYFTSYSDAVKWGKEQFENFDLDMVRYIDKSSPKDNSDSVTFDPTTETIRKFAARIQGTDFTIEYKGTKMYVVGSAWARSEADWKSWYDPKRTNKDAENYGKLGAFVILSDVKNGMGKAYVRESDFEELVLTQQSESMESKKEPAKKVESSTKDFEGSQESGTGKLYEYFTPMEVVEKMWALAYHYGKTAYGITPLPLYGMKVLDPAMGSGRLFTYAPKSAKVTGFEINKSNEEVAMKYCVSRGFNRIQLYNESFEVAFLNPPRYNSKLKGKNPTWLDEYPFDLVVANPPYGKFTGLYKTHFNFNGQFEHFFIEYSMKLVKQNGLGIFVVPSSFLRNGNTYNSVKERIFNECKLLDAYRLPANIFKHTQIGTDIIVLQKK